LAVLGFELGLTLARQALYHLNHSTSPFLCWVFLDRFSRTICLGWLWTLILLISASSVARTTGVSHQHYTLFIFFAVNKLPEICLFCCW
jgi:hypothetical protein